MKQVFSQLSTGLDELDAVLCGIYPGDNIVFQVDTIADYIQFVRPFSTEVLAQNNRLVYFRFANHPPLLPEEFSSFKIDLDPNPGFENFVYAIYDTIEEKGTGACYVFDCISDLAAEWYSDRMLSNFFLLVCPYLYTFETVAYFSLLRNRHLTSTTKTILDTAQVVVDILQREKDLFIKPRKVWRRQSKTMYMLHKHESNAFVPVTESAIVAQILTTAGQPWLDFSLEDNAIWNHNYRKAWTLALSGISDKNNPEASQVFKQLLRLCFTRDERLLALAERYFELSDLLEIRRRMIGTGLIGGKSLGMLLARAILLKTDPAWQDVLEVNDSFYIGSDVFYTYLIQNGCWQFRRKLAKGELSFENAEQVRTKILAGNFPQEVIQQFEEMLNYFGQAPIIVRSSSLLEDAYGNAFSGKYESYFCANQGTFQQRLEEFLSAVRKVYASTFTKEALTYRAQRGLLEADEQMALLVQRVSGIQYGSFFFPQLAGVAYSFNPYVWSEEIEPASGVLRLVFGLGTRAVNRSDDDYTRLVSLNAWHKRPFTELTDQVRYAQHRVDLIDLVTNAFSSLDFSQIADELPESVLSLFTTASRELTEDKREHRSKKHYVLSFDRLLAETTFISKMKNLLTNLEAAYQYPVDIEFTANFVAGQGLKINLLQCRPFQFKVNSLLKITPPPDLAVEDILIQTSGPLIGTSRACKLDAMIYVKPESYASLSLSQGHSVARLIGKLMSILAQDPTKNIMLLGPGRWGTSTPALGVPVSFSEISRARVLGEVAKLHSGLVPDISLGTHFFNDLVEYDILYLGIYPDRTDYIFNQTKLDELPNYLTRYLPEASSLQNVVRVIVTDNSLLAGNIYLSADVIKQKAVCYYQP